MRAQAVRYVPDRDAIEIVTTRNAGFLISREWIGALQDVPRVGPGISKFETPRPGALPCLRQTAAPHLILAELARAEETLGRDGYDISDNEIDARYWRLRALHPDAPACCRLEPGAAMTAQPGDHLIVQPARPSAGR